MIILLDVDGVICNFIDGLIASHGWRITHDEYVSWNHHRDMGVSDEEMWAPTRAPGWWLGLHKYKWSSRLVSELNKLGEIIFCTAPSADAECPSQKVQWLRSNGFLGGRSVNYQIGKRKELNAKSGAILIDDSDSNVSKFIECGGEAVLFPMPWNANWHIAGDKVDFVVKELQSIASKQSRNMHGSV